MEKQSSKNLIVTYGILLGTLSVLISVVKYTFSANFLEKNIFENVLGLLLIIILIVIPIRLFRNSNITLKVSDAMKIGLGVAVIAGLISIIYFYILANYIQPDLSDLIINTEMEKAMKENPNMSSADMAKGIEMGKKFVMPMLYMGIIIANLFIGLLVSSISGLILKKE
jgi:Protein of unknown function (DUF4199)